MDYDIAVIGCGVAASAALRALKDFQGSIVVIAPKPEPATHIAQTLAPSAIGVMDQLGILDAFDRADYLPVELAYTVWGRDTLTEHSSMKRREGPGWYVDREVFESWLWSEAKAETNHLWVEDSLRHFERDGEGWQLNTRDGQVIKARYLLDATGRAMVVGRKLSERMVMDQLTALFMSLKQVDDEIYATEATMVEAVPDGWWFSAVMEQGKMTIAFFTDSDLFDRSLMKNPRVWRAHLAESQCTAERVESAGFSCFGVMPQSTGANSVRLKAFGGERWLAMGDAAMAFDPLSSHGITTALWSGRNASLAAVAELEGDTSLKTTYIETAEKGWLNYEQMHRSIYGQERRFLDAPFWQRRHSAVPFSSLNS